MKTNKTGKIFRIAAIIMVGMTAAMNLLGGIGTICAAFFTKQYPPMWSLFELQWLYQTFVVTTILVGLAGIWTVVNLVRGSKNVYRNTLIVLLVGLAINIIHVIVSISLRGKATPADVVMGINLLTVLLMLYLGTPKMRKSLNFEKETSQSEKTTASGIAAIVTGLAVLSTSLWAGPTHTYKGTNWVDLLIVPLVVSGVALLGLGSAKLVRLVIENRKRAELQSEKTKSTSAI